MTRTAAAIGDARVRLERWKAKHAERLTGLHPDLAAEIESVAWAGFRDGTPRALTAEDLRQCKMRVATRMRLKRYRHSPPGDEESGRQLREMLTEIEAYPPEQQDA